MKFRLKKLCILLLLLTLSSALVKAQEKDSNFALYKELTIFHNILKELNLLYIDSIDNEYLIDVATNAMLNELDPYTKHIHGYQSIDFKALTDGEYGGIGARWWAADSSDIFQLQSLYKDSPANKAGLKVGDQAIAVNGKLVSKMSFSEFISSVSGPPNTKVKITVKRFFLDKEQTIDILITRKKIDMESILLETVVQGDIGYIFLANFTNKTEWKVKEAIMRLKEQNIKGLIIDIRGNPGGLIKQGVKTANLFIGKDLPVLKTKSRISQLDKEYTTTKVPIAPDLPLVILIDHNTSSASEVFAGILQDMDRAVILGSRSYGKGLIQKTRDLGYGEKLKITTSQFYIPSGRSIQGIDHRRLGKENGVIEFKTRAGRKVYAGGGITPDILAIPKAHQPITQYLLYKFEMSYFVNWYCETHKDIPKDFKVSDEIFESFKKFITTKKHSYETPEYLEFLKLKNSIENSQLEKDSRKELSVLLSKAEQILAPNLVKSMDTYKDEIKIVLTEEIIAHVYGNIAKYKLIINNDFHVKEAATILKDNKKYKGLLDGSVPAHSAEKPDFSEK